MKKNSMLPVKNSITTQLLKVIFFFYIIVTIVMTIVHMSAEFNSTKKNVEHELRVIGNTFAPALARALWDMNVEQLNPTFLGMVESPTVVGMMIKNEKGMVVGAAGTILNEERKVVQMEPDGNTSQKPGYKGLFSYSFPINYQLDNKYEIFGIPFAA